MGYDVHITRKENWFDQDKKKSIALKEWINYIQSDKEMELVNEAVHQSTQLTYQNSGLAIWTGYSGHGHNHNYAWFDFRNGNIVIKNPDTEIINKVRKIAEQLKASVQGDEGNYF